MNANAIDSAWNLLIDITCKSCLLFALAGCSLFLLRRAAAASRHLVLCLLLGALLSLPLLASLLPRWQVLWQIPAGQELPVPSASVTAAEPEILAPLTPPHTRIAPSVTAEHASPEASVHTESFLPAPSVPLASGNATAEVISFWKSDMLKRNALALWLLGGSVIFLRLMAGGIALHRLRRRSLPVTREAVQQLAAEAQKTTDLQSNVTLLQMRPASSVRVPIVWGLFRPAILLPAALLDWTPERLRLILLHEMAHIRRHDGLVQAMGQLACALLWFHPLVWWAVRRMREECERACDDAVLLTGILPSTYADTLLEVIRNMKNSRSFPQLALSMARPPIEKRLRAILTPRPTRFRTLQRPVAALLWLGTAACALPLAALHVSATPEPRKTETRQFSALPDFDVSGDHTVNLARLPQSAAQEQEAREREAQARAERERAEKERAISRRSGQERGSELDALRDRLKVLESALMATQRENQELRRQLERVRAQQGRTDKQRDTDFSKKEDEI